MRFYRFAIISLLSIIITGQLFATNQPPPYRIRKVVIDAGHGGKDPGAKGRIYSEKNIVLAIALKVGNSLKALYPDIEVIYTRDSDYFVELYKRAEIANKAGADLFISIHCNSLPAFNNTVSGSETYVLGLHKLAENLAVAQRENASAKLEAGWEQRYGNFENNATDFIANSVYQGAYMEQSITLAGKIESQLKTSAGRKSKGVKQAGFLVIREVAMPSVLIETGFLSNAAEEKFLGSEEGQQSISDAIVTAFGEYKRLMEGDDSPQPITTAQEPAPKNTVPTPTNKAPNPTETVASKKPEQIPVKTIVTPVVQPKKEPTTPPQKETAPDKVVYRVQVASSPSPLETTGDKWKKIEFLYTTREAGQYKYMAGDFNSEKEAINARNYLSGAGWKGCFVVAYINDKRVSVESLRKP